jgi:signal transduction histidine kinase/HAMP domain-containing protein
LPLLTGQEWQTVERYWTYPVGSTHEDYLGYIFNSQGVTFEIGFASIETYDFTNQIVSSWIFLLLVSHIFVVLVFPKFFQRTLVRPLDNLLKGVAQVDQGELNTIIPVSSNDEIGFLTQSFNSMVDSLRGLTFELKVKASELEDQVNLRTMELIQTNEKLITENKEKIQAETKIKQQYTYQQALANCSRALLINPENNKSQKEILNQALEHLRSGVEASRAYIFRNIIDSNKDLYFGMIAEVSAPAISPQIQNPVNQKFPAYQLPKDFVNKLSIGEQFGGSTEEIFKSTPNLLDALLSQPEPLLSMQCFPIFLDDHWWGFIGFDDCLTRRRWNESETTLLQTASEMIGNTFKRWEIEGLLMETLDQLDQRVLRRTEALNNSNILLNKEIQQRQEAQKDLEARLLIEKQLALISTRLLEPTDIRNNIKKSLENLGNIMHAGRIFMIEFEPNIAYQLRDFLEWHLPDIQPLTEEIIQNLINALSGFEKRMGEGETIFIKDTGKYQSIENVDLSPLRERNVKSLVLSPLIIDQNIRGVLGCSNLLSSVDQMEVDISALELVAGMLISLLQREYLIQSLEEQVAERTHQLTAFLDMAMLKEQSHDLADILQPTLLSIMQIADCDAVVIHITNDQKSELELIAQRGIPLIASKNLDSIKLTPDLVKWLNSNEPIEGLGNLNKGFDFPNQFILDNYQSFLGNRIITDRNPFGVISCYRISNQSFSPFQRTFLTAIGDLLGIIVDNYRLKIEAEELAAVEERQRLAREIHDAISQSVYSLSLFARSARDAVGEDDQEKLLSNLDDIELTALQAMREMRLLLYQLRESGKDKDIRSSLVNRFQQVENRLGIQASHNIDQDIKFTPKVSHEIWRILVESLNNVVKHADASRVQVEITCNDDHLSVTIRDNGRGFDTNAYSPGMGLKNIRTRAESIDGTLEVISRLGEGTQVIIKIPIACGNSEERV